MKKISLFLLFFSSALFGEERYLAEDSIPVAYAIKIEEIHRQLIQMNRNQDAIIMLLGNIARICMYYEPEIHTNAIKEAEHKTRELAKEVKEMREPHFEDYPPMASFTQ